MKSRFSFRELCVAVCFCLLLALHVAVCDQAGGLRSDTESSLNGTDRCLSSIDKFDLTPLSRFVWNVSQRVGSNVFEYRISLCTSLRSPAGCEGSSICRLSRGNEESAVSLGTIDTSLEADVDEDDAGFWLKFRGATCPGGGNHRAFLNLQCGTSLGSPLLIGVYDDCRSYFLWETSAACLNVTDRSPRDEVPCYVYDSLGSRYDLSGLSRTKGGIYIPPSSDVGGEWHFYINVCSTIVPDDGTSGCPSGSAACKVLGNEARSVGRLNDAVRLTDDGKVLLEYVDDVDTASNCTNRPRTTITFSCPGDGRDQKPVLVSDSDCDHQIEWVTAVACPWKMMQSTDACHLNSDIDGIDEDITSLHVENGMPHHAEDKIEGKNYDFYLSVCGGFPAGFACGDDGSASANARVCRKSVDDPRGVILGSTTNQSLRFVDGQLYLSYHGGSPCYATVSSQPRAVLIHLKCASATGRNEPRFVQEEECVTFFEWETNLACVQRMIGSVCYVNDGGRVIDLSTLTRGQGEEPWLAIGPQAVPRIYVNVCGPVGRSSASTASCPVGASVCVAGDDGRMVDFGRYVTRPTLDRDTGDVRLNYTGLDSCQSNPRKFMSSLITFVCHPGEMNGGPRLISTSLDGCSMEFEWPTAAACVQFHVNGTNCKVADVQKGFTFDLNPLRMQDGTHYQITAGEYDYFLNVCGGVSESPCSIVGGEVGACQVKRTDKTVVNSLGSPTDTLTYYNGLVTLTYKDTIDNRSAVITFVCDRLANVGHPQFVNATQEVYNFQWKTSHVCPPRLIECVFLNDATRELYDLSSLSRSFPMGDWVVLDSTFKGLKRKFYINVCRRLTRSDDSARRACAEGSALCATRIVDTDEKPLIANLGRAESAPHFEHGQLTVRYTTGEPCHDLSGPKMNYSAVVYFHCANYSVINEEETGPIFLRNRSCEYMFLWSSQAACPMRIEYAGNGCSVTDSKTGYTFGFDSLDSDFVVPVPSSDVFQNFHVSVCGVLNTSACGKTDARDKREPVAACGELRDGISSVMVATSASRRVYVTDGGIVKMEFDGPQNVTSGKPDYRMEIVFLCHRQLYSPSPRFVRQDDDLLVFEYKSPLTCPPQVVDCVFSDRRGNTYDLSALARRGHYEVMDSRPAKQNVLYHLAVCRPLLTPPFSNCPEDVNVGACMSDSKSGIAYSLGYVQGRPRAGLVTGATVSLTYHSGSPCKNGTGRMSTRIDFKCSSQQSEPQFVSESGSCEYSFFWETPLACPLEQTVGSNCHVVDDRYSTRFDLSKLSRPEGYVIDGGNSSGSHKIFRVNACGPLSVDCNGQKEVGVCVDDGSGLKFSGGHFSDKLIYDQGEIMLRYDTDEGTTSMIRFVCDHTTTGQVEGPTYLNAESSNTSNVFVWSTAFACRSFRESNCRVYRPEDNALFDLGRLTLLDGNYEVIVGNGSYKYLINICRSVVHAKDAMCHYGAAVCGVNLTEANRETRYSNIGEVGDVGPTFEKGFLSLKYEMGEMCRKAGASGSHKTTTIRFSCDPDAEEGEPYLMAEDGCQYLFGWSSAFACPVKSDGAGSTLHDDCTAVNPNNGYEFDFNSLRHSSYHIAVSNVTDVTFGICEMVSGTPCGSGVGSCLHSGFNVAASAGDANANLQYREEMLILNYTNGETCFQSGRNATTSTVITFTCAPSGMGIGTPLFVEHSECTYFVSWHTELACETHVRCAVELDREVIDLSPLMKSDGHHFAIGDSNEDAVYVLNVCRPLGTVTGQQCPSRSAACRYDGKTGVSLSLGTVVKAPFVSFTGHVILEYTNGSTCPHDPRLTASTRIIFQCDESMFPDVVRLIDVTENCTYVFEWPTYVVCPVVTHGIVSANCSYYDTRTKESFDLARLSVLAPSGFQVKHDAGNGVFAVNFCMTQVTSGRSGPCASAAVCLLENDEETSWGSSGSALYDYDGQHLRVSYKGGDPCPDSAFRNMSSVIWFSCDENVGTGTPELAKYFDCQVIFYWRTSLICRGHPRSTECTVLHNGQLYDLRLLSSYSQSWTVEDPSSPHRMFWLNVCGQLVGKRDPRCPSKSAVCWKASEDRVLSIGSSAIQTLTVSDDGQMLLLSYSVTTDVCGRNNLSNVSLSSSSVIQFACSSKASEPRLISRGTKNNNCTFTFHWETPIACSQTSSIEILERNGQIVDENLDLVVDLSPLFKGYGVAVEHRGDDEYDYHVSLFGLDFVAGQDKCRGAAICQTKRGNSAFQRIIGNAAGRKFYLQGPELVVKLESSSVCGRNPYKNVSSMITMHCSPSTGTGSPHFVYESIDCNYVFDWESDAVCAFEAFHREIGDDVQFTRRSSSKGIVTAFAVALAVMFALVAVVIFRHRQKLLPVFVKWCPSFVASSCCSPYRQQPRHGSVSFARLADDTESAHIIC